MDKSAKRASQRTPDSPSHLCCPASPSPTASRFAACRSDPLSPLRKIELEQVCIGCIGDLGERGSYCAVEKFKDGLHRARNFFLCAVAVIRSVKQFVN
eukprot:1549201-Pleurochrysis_carterae.AAC.1